ncbi:MAG: VWA domain-containing protein [Phycisphaerales bacterium]|jgi:hypothetical protein|nr:VWA domain-containing protein [Phycisphaerales bacterium]
MLNDIWQWLLGIKPGQYAGGDGATFRFVADYSGEIVLGMAAVFAGLIFLVIRSYLREGDASKKAKGALAAIRIIVITAIFVILFRPAMVHQFTNTLYSSVVILIDDSLSMSFGDKYLDPTRRSDEADAEYQARLAEGAARKTALAEELGLAPEELDKMSRTDIVRKMLLKRGGPLAELAKDHPLVLMRFSTAETGQPYTQKILDVPDIYELSDNSTSRPAEIALDPKAVSKALDIFAAAPTAETTPSSMPAGDSEQDKLLEKFQSLPEENIDARLAVLAALAGGGDNLIEKLNAQRDDPMLTKLGAGLAQLNETGQFARRIALAGLVSAGYETNLATAIRNALAKVSGRRLGGVVVISDGRITSTGLGNGRLSSALDFARESKVPMYGVAVGDPVPPKNLTVAALQAPREIRKDSEAEFTATITHRNLDRETVTVRLQEKAAGANKWVDTGVTKNIVLSEASRDAQQARSLQTAALVYTPAKLGDFSYRAIVDPIIGEDKISDNNSPPSLVTVSENRIRILIISGDAGWEFQYLRNFLVRQRDMYRISVWQQNADPDVNQAASSGMKLTKLPRTRAELMGVRGDKTKPGYDVVILYDPQHTQNGFDGEFVKLLAEFVKTRNGGLCYIAGNKHTDDTMMGKGKMKVLADELLPVVLAPNTINIAIRIRQDSPVAWPVKLSSYGVEHPITRLGGSDDDTKKIWQVLPGQYWSHPVYKIKPGARPLAVSSNPMRKMANGDDLPLIVAGTVGSGRSVYIGMEGTWRWRYVHDGYYHRRFWARTIRYLASMRTRLVEISTGGNRFSAGEKITIEVKACDKEYKPITDKEFVVEMRNIVTGESELITLPAVDATKKETQGQYKRTIVAARTGSFEITAPPQTRYLRDDIKSKKIVIELPQAEARRREADRRTLREIASREDRFLDIHEVAELPKRIPHGRLQTTRYQIEKLWDIPLTLIVIVLLLTIEWLGRKKYNMA